MSMTTTAAKKRSNAGHFLFTYRIRKGEQDPVIDRIRTCMDDTGYTIGRVAKESGVSYGAISNWIEGVTMRPQFATCAAAIRSMGYDFAVVPANHKVNGHAWDAAMPPVVKRFKSARSVVASS